MKVKLVRPWKVDYSQGVPISVLFVVTREDGIRIGWIRREGRGPWTAHTEANRREPILGAFDTTREAARAVVQRAQFEVARATVE